jgi:hypothetical protein
LTPKVVAAEPEKKPEPKPEPKPAVAVTADVKVSGPTKAEAKTEAKDGSGSVAEVHASASAAIEGVGKADNASLELNQSATTTPGYSVNQGIKMYVGECANVYKKTLKNGDTEEIRGASMLPAKTVKVIPGPKGDAGRDGKDGKDGTNGKDGANGKDGRNGRDGKDGVTKTVTVVQKVADENGKVVEKEVLLRQMCDGTYQEWKPALNTWVKYVRPSK